MSLFCHSCALSVTLFCPVIFSRNVAWSVNFSVFKSLLYFPFEASHLSAFSMLFCPIQNFISYWYSSCYLPFLILWKINIFEAPWGEAQDVLAPSCQGSHLTPEMLGYSLPSTMIHHWSIQCSMCPSFPTLSPILLMSYFYWMLVNKPTFVIGYSITLALAS